MAASVSCPCRSKGFALVAIFWLAALGALCGRSFADEESLSRINVGDRAPQFNARGADGRRHSLSDFTGKIVVLEWTSPVCPYTAVKYNKGTMQALQKYAVDRGVIWLSIDTAAADRAGYLTALAARERVARLHASVSGFLFDPDGHIARSYGARATPGFFIIDRDGTLAYQGAMDDPNAGDRSVPEDYVHDALDDLLAHAKVRVPETQPYGCGIEY
jgi:AhpC/TSA family